MTLAEYEALLKAEGRYDAMKALHAENEAALQRRAAELRRAEQPVVEALRAVGWEVESVWNLVNTASPYPEALPIFLQHLQRPCPGPIREGIARALAVTKLYRLERDKRAKDGLAVAIAAVADHEVIGGVIALARDKQHAGSRLLLLSALERSRDPRALEALAELRTDPELEKEIRVILRRLKRAKH